MSAFCVPMLSHPAIYLLHGPFNPVQCVSSFQPAPAGVFELAGFPHAFFDLCISSWYRKRQEALWNHVTLAVGKRSRRYSRVELNQSLLSMLYLKRQRLSCAYCGCSP